MAESANNQSLSAVTEGHQYVSVSSSSNNNSNATSSAQSSHRTTRGRPRTSLIHQQQQQQQSGGNSSNNNTSTTTTRKTKEKLSTRSGTKRSVGGSIKSKSKSPRKRIIESDTEDTEEERRVKLKTRPISESSSVQSDIESASTVASRTRSRTVTSHIPLGTSKQSRTKSSVDIKLKSNSEDSSSGSEGSSLLKLRRSQFKKTRQSSSVTIKKAIRDSLQTRRTPTSDLDSLGVDRKSRAKSQTIEEPKPSTSRNLRSHHLHPNQQPNPSTSQTLSTFNSTKLGTRQANQSSCSSSLSGGAVPKKRQKVGEQQQSPDNSGISEKLPNLGARFGRSGFGREPQPNLTDTQVNYILKPDHHQLVIFQSILKFSIYFFCFPGATSRSPKT